MLALCMIVRDEEENLRQHLPRMREAADELVVVDTGSRDQSARVAAEMGARVYTLDWRDDFSEARNFALQQATAPWILTLDADETVSLCHLPLLRMLAGSAPDKAYRFPTRNYVAGSQHVLKWNPCKSEYPEEHVASGWYPTLKVRMFPNRPEVRYQYNVQERVEPSLAAAGIPVHAAGLWVHHFGTLAPCAKQARRNVYLETHLRYRVVADPDGVDSLWELARQQVRNGRLKEAQKSYREVLRRASWQVEAREELAYLLWRWGDYRQAAAQAHKVLDDRSYSSVAWYVVALCGARAGAAGEAINAARRAVQSGPHSPMACYALGVCLLAGGQRAPAQENLLKSLALDPRFHPALVRLGQLAIQDGRIEDAFQYLARAVQERPACAETQGLLGAALLASDRLAEARVHLARADSLSPDCPDVLSNLALAHLKSGDPRGARELLSRALQLDPDHPGALQCWRRLGDPVKP